MNIKNSSSFIARKPIVVFPLLVTLFLTVSIFALNRSAQNPQIQDSEAAETTSYVKGSVIVQLKIDNDQPLSDEPTRRDFESRTTVKDFERIKMDTFVGETTKLGISDIQKIVEIPLPEERVHLYTLSFDKKIPVEKMVAQLKNREDVVQVFPNYIATIDQTASKTYPNDRYYLDSYPKNVSFRDPAWNPSYDYMWNLKQINASKGWTITKGSPNVKIAILDTGVDYNVAELSGKVINGKDFVNNDNDSIDDHGHGTHVAGISAAKTNNIQGIAGVCPECKILAVKVLDKNGSGAVSGIISAINYAADNGAKVINMSLSAFVFPEDQGTDVFDSSLAYAYNKGVTIVAAAGNSGLTATHHIPASNTCKFSQTTTGNDCVITVGASDQGNKLTSYSSDGDYVDVVAPGGGARDVISLKSNKLSGTIPDYVFGGSYVRLMGTSMAAPHVAGLAGLIVSKDPNLGPDAVRNIILNGSSTIGFNADGRVNTGLINIGTSLTNMNQSKPAFPTPYYLKDFMIKNNKLWESNSASGWTIWKDETTNISSVGGIATEIKSLSTFYHPGNYIVQYLVKGNDLWTRNNQNGWSQWVPITQNVAGSVCNKGTGPITSFNAYVDKSGKIVENLTRGGRIYTRSNLTSCQAWTDITDIVTKGSGTITSFSVHIDNVFHSSNESTVSQDVVRGGSLWRRSQNIYGWLEWQNIDHTSGDVSGPYTSFTRNKLRLYK